MSNFNYAHFIHEAIDAILSQSRLPDEFIIIDDASTDNSIEVIQNLIKNFSFIKLVRHKKNTGVIDLANEGIRISSGDFLYLAASDDKILPGFIEKSMQFLEENPNLSICTSIPGFFNNTNSSDITFNPMHRNGNIIFDKKNIIKALRYENFWLPSHSTIIRRDIAIKYGGYTKRLNHFCDWFLNIKIVLMHGMGYLAEPLAAMRMHQNSYSAQKRKNTSEERKIFYKLLDIIEEEDKDLKSAFKNSGVINQLGMKNVVFLISKPNYWSYLVPILARKFKKLCIKLNNSIRNAFFSIS
jgi:glycosyltransferase involved in cell wall biosynthesis